MARLKRETIFSSTQLMLIRKGLQMNMSEAAEILCRVKQRSYYQYEFSDEVGKTKMELSTKTGKMVEKRISMSYTPDEQTQARILRAVKLRAERLDKLDSLMAENPQSTGLDACTLDVWLERHNPTLDALLDCKLDWFIDMSVKAELTLRYSASIEKVKSQ